MPASTPPPASAPAPDTAPEAAPEADTGPAPGTAPRLAPIGCRPSLAAYLADCARRVPFLCELVSSRAAAEQSRGLLGPLWLLLTPLLTAALYFVVFGMLLGARHSVPDYPLFLLTGVLLYQFLSRSVSGAGRSLRRQRDLVQTIPFPRLLVPAAALGVEARQLLWSMGLLLCIAAASVGVSASWAALLPAVACLVAMAFGMGLVAARVQDAFPDAGGLLPFALRAGAYLSGAYFPVSGLASGAPALSSLLAWNPVALALDGARAALTGSALLPAQWAVLAGCSLLALAVGVLALWSGEPSYGRR